MLAETTFISRTANEWEAIGTWVTVLVAIAAACVALKQIKAAKQIRIEESWPYVAIYIESVPSKPKIVELVIRNFGHTVAMAVAISTDKPLMRTGNNSGEGPENVKFPASIPTLVPGQEWRTLWDFGPDRAESDLPSKYRFEVSYKSSDGTSHEHTYEIDWATYLGRRWIEIQTVHDVAQSLKHIEKTVAKWSDSIHGSVSVYVRDGDKKDADRRAEEARFPEEVAAFKALIKRNELSSSDSDAGEDTSPELPDTSDAD
jgi:hypothetical protein